MDELNNEELLGTEGGACGASAYQSGPQVRHVTPDRVRVTFGPLGGAYTNVRIIGVTINGKRKSVQGGAKGLLADRDGAYNLHNVSPYGSDDIIEWRRQNNSIQITRQSKNITNVEISYEVGYKNPKTVKFDVLF